MRVRVLFFGMLKDLAGASTDSLELPDGSTLADLLDHYETRLPRLKDFLPSIALSINREYANPAERLHAGDEVALLPPVSGGLTEQKGNAASGALRSPHAAIVREKIEADAIVQQIKQPEDGAVAVFDGIVRNHSRGRRTLYLEYEAYELMALDKMEDLVRQALQQFRIRDVALIHRLGRLEIGETSVLIVVASAHRAAAFDACRWLIDALKRSVPIWKKEYFEDGAVWADGEPFPAEIPRAQATAAEDRASK
jgi:molybdopterin synthase catalytic subunit